MTTLEPLSVCDVFGMVAVESDSVKIVGAILATAFYKGFYMLIVNGSILCQCPPLDL